MKKWLLAALLLAGSASAQNTETVPPQCTVAQLAAGTCAPAKLGTRVRISNNGVATGDSNCASGTGANLVLCEYDGSSWVSIDTLYGVGGASASNEYYYAVDYASIQAAVDACHAGGDGGTVVLPRGKTTIDMTGDADNIAISLPSRVQGVSSSINNTCNLLGYGDLRSSQDDEPDGTDIHITNSGGDTGIMMDAGGITMKGFRLFFEGQDANTIGINTGDADSDAFGYRVVDVTVASDQGDGSQIGTGIQIKGNLEGVWENVSSINWKYGVRYMEKFTGAAGNNVIWLGGRMAVNETGVFMGGGTETTAFGNTQFYGTVVEGNTAAAFNLNVSDGRLMLFGVHTESNVTDEILVSGSGRYECYDCKIDGTGHNALKRSANVGPDVVYGGEIRGNIAYTAPGTVNWSGSPTLFTSSITGTSTVDAAARQTKTTDYTITLNDAVFWRMWDNVGAAGTVIYTLPAAIKGFDLQFCQKTAAQTLTIDPAGAEIIEFAGGSLAAGETITTIATVSPNACVELESLVAGTWRVKSSTGTWNEGSGELITSPGLFNQTTGVLYPKTSTDDLANDATGTAWSITDSGAAAFVSLNVTPSATPNILLTDSTTAGEAKIAANDAAGPDTVLSLQVDIASTLTTFIEADGVTETVDILKPMVVTGGITASGAVVSPAPIATSTGGTLTLNTITLATAAADYDIPDNCDTATGAFVMVQVRDVSEVASITTLDTGDTIVYKGIATLVANDELDSPGAIGDSVVLVCLEADKWYMTSTSGAWVDGGTAD